MIFAFVIPLVMGCLFYTIIYLTKTNKYFNRLSLSLLNSSILAFSLGSIMKGVLDIYGTTNSMLVIYIWIGISLIVLSIIFNIIYNLKKKEMIN